MKRILTAISAIVLTTVLVAGTTKAKLLADSATLNGTLNVISKYDLKFVIDGVVQENGKSLDMGTIDIHLGEGEVRSTTKVVVIQNVALDADNVNPTYTLLFDTVDATPYMNTMLKIYEPGYEDKPIYNSTLDRLLVDITLHVVNPKHSLWSFGMNLQQRTMIQV